MRNWTRGPPVCDSSPGEPAQPWERGPCLTPTPVPAGSLLAPSPAASPSPRTTLTVCWPTALLSQRPLTSCPGAGCLVDDLQLGECRAPPAGHLPSGGHGAQVCHHGHSFPRVGSGRMKRSQRDSTEGGIGRAACVAWDLCGLPGLGVSPPTEHFWAASSGCRW